MHGGHGQPTCRPGARFRESPQGTSIAVVLLKTITRSTAMTPTDRPDAKPDARPGNDRTSGRESQASQPAAGNLPQRSTRAPAEGADDAREDGKAYDHAPADHGQAGGERDARDPAEGRPDAADGRTSRGSDAATASPGHAGSGNSLGDGRTAGGAQNAPKRDRLAGQ
jgi:hypothetical protein